MTAQNNATIMIVEDDLALGDAFRLVLSTGGYDAQLAVNGKVALKKLEEITPDLILLDILMPVMDGREFLKNFKNSKQIPIVVLSNLDTRSDIEDILSLGATHYMLKSDANPKALLELVANTLDRTA